MGIGRFAWAVFAVALAVGGGCNNGPTRTLDRDSTVVVDLGQPDIEMVDVGMDAPRDASRDAADAGDALDASDARTDRVAVDGDSDGGDAARDVFIESSVIGCMTNMECGSASLYCNASTCAGRGFCTTRPDPMSCDDDGGAGEVVCGCNGMSYPSLCALQAAGVRLVAFGMCARD